MFKKIKFLVNTFNAGLSSTIDTFCSAAENGDIDTVKKYLSKYGSAIINQHSRDWTALMHASSKGHENIVKLLLENKPRIDEKDGNGWTALMHATSAKQKNIVEFLLDNDADYTIKGLNTSYTALSIAQSPGGDPAIADLIQQWPEIRQKRLEELRAREIAEIDCSRGLRKAMRVLGALKLPA